MGSCAPTSRQAAHSVREFLLLFSITHRPRAGILSHGICSYRLARLSRVSNCSVAGAEKKQEPLH
jgi:hypothetical protein